MRFSYGRTHQPCLSDMPPRPKILNLLAGIFVRGATPDKQIKYGPLAQWLEQATHNRTVIGSNPVGATIFGCNTASGTCVVSGLVTLKGLPFPLAQATNQVAGMCKPRS